TQISVPCARVLRVEPPYDRGEPVRQRDAWFPAELGLCTRDVGERRLDVAKWDRSALDVDGSTRGPCHRRDELGEADRSTRPQIVGPDPFESVIDRSQDSPHDVLYVREVWAHRPITEQRAGLPRQDVAEEARDRHLGPLPRTVHGEET